MFFLLVPRYRLPPAGTPEVQRAGSFDVSSSSVTLNHPDTLQLIVTVLDRSGNPMDVTPNYASSDAAVATISASGLITSVGADSFTITISYDRKSTTVAGTVNGAPGVVDAVAISPSTAQALLIGSSVILEATPTSGGVELPCEIDWESETANRVTIDDTLSSPYLYKHAQVTGAGVGTTRVRAKAVGAGAGGVDVFSAWVDFTVSTTVPTGEPNLPVGWTIFSDWLVTSIPYPINTPNAEGWFITSGGDYNRVARVADAGSPSGYVMRVYYPPTHNGGSGPEHVSNDFAATHLGLYIQQLKRLSAGFTNASNTGTKEMFVRMVNQANNIYLNKYDGSNDVGRAGVNVQGITFTGGAQPNVQSIFSWNNLMDGALHMWEVVLRQQSATSVHDGNSLHFMDGAVDKQSTNRQYINDGVNPTTRPFEHVHRSGTYGGGHNRPPGVIGVGANGQFVRSLGLYAKLGSVNVSNTRQFVLTAGQTLFNTTNSSSDDARDWTIIYANGTTAGPYQILAANRTATTLTFPTGVNVTNAVAVVSGFEIFDPVGHVGDTIYLRSPTLDFHPNTNPNGSGLFPLLLQTVVTSVSSTNFPNDTINFVGNPGSGTMWLFGLDANQISMPIYDDTARIVLAAP